MKTEEKGNERRSRISERCRKRKVERWGARGGRERATGGERIREKE